MRDKLRSQFADDVLGSIKQAALGQLALGGPANVSINAIGRELGVSGPALYRYVSGRDELIATLMIDAYDDLTAALATASAGRRTPRTRLAGCATAYRDWALAQPHRYQLLFEAPPRGYEADPEVMTASQGAMNVLIDVLAEFPPRRPTPSTGIAGWLDRRGLPVGVGPAAETAIGLWARMHGLVSLELSGCFASMGVDVSRLYEREVTGGLD